ncbi:M56 family peptidase, partial [Streptomyces sp. SID69]|nr:M56 family peptidase [Streptomyces sp. SID69]
MRFDVYSPLVLSLLLALAAPLTGRYVAPAVAARVLAGAAVVTACATTWSLVLLGAALLGDVPAVTRAAGAGGQAAADPVPVVIGVAAWPALAVVGVRLFRAVRAERRTR